MNEKSKRQVKTISRERCGVEEAFFKKEKVKRLVDKKTLKDAEERDAW